MKAWPVASAALPYVSPNANGPQFKQLFHLDLCKCVYKYGLINMAFHILKSELKTSIPPPSPNENGRRMWDGLMASRGMGMDWCTCEHVSAETCVLSVHSFKQSC